MRRPAQHACLLPHVWNPDSLLPMCSLASFAPTINKSARALCDRLALAATEGSLIDIRPMIHAFTLDTIARVAFG